LPRSRTRPCEKYEAPRIQLKCTLMNSRLRTDKRGVDLISDALSFGRLWYNTPDNAIGYAMHCSRSAKAVIRVYDATGNVTPTPSGFAEVVGDLASTSVRLALGSLDFVSYSCLLIAHVV
jgi:hypothetical protein